MAMSSDEVRRQQQRRANWVGLRTFRLRPSVIGATAAGDPVVEVDTVRLVLERDAGYFRRLVPCASCQGDVAGSPVTGLGDLAAPPLPVLCVACVKRAGTSDGWRPHEQELPDRAGPPVTRDLEPLDRRLGGVEAQVAALDQAVARMQTDAGAREQGVEQAMARLSSMVAGLRGDLDAAVDAAVRAQVGSLVAAYHGLAAAMEAGDQRVRALEERLRDLLDSPVAPPPTLEHGAGDLLMSLDAQLRAAESRMAARTVESRVDALIDPAARVGRPGG